MDLSKIIPSYTPLEVTPFVHPVTTTEGLNGLEGYRRLTAARTNRAQVLSNTPGVESNSTPGVDRGIPIFRRGGEVDVQKRNVIVDGPSHDEDNNTNIKGDRGIPVVIDGKKVIEIESEELVFHEGAMAKIHALKLRVEKGDDSARVELDTLIKEELLNNTYDYTKELL